MAAYLARHGAENWRQTVAIRKMFGQVREFWMLDMGLGSDEERFQIVFEEELDNRRLAEKVVDPNGISENEEEIEIGEENNVVVVGLAAQQTGNQLGEEMEMAGDEIDGAGANPNDQAD